MPGQRPRRDHYAVLKVPRDASAREISSAYHGLVRELHPDARPADPTAAEQLADVLAAYRTLGDPRRRAAYDAGQSEQPSRTGSGQPVAVRVTVRTRSYFAQPVPPHRARRDAASLPDAPDRPFFPASWHIGLSVRLPAPEWDDFGCITRIMQQWLRLTDTWP